MKKLMIGIAGIMAMVASVNAADTEKIKAACQSSDKTVWVEKTQACVPVNPCESGNETIRSLYCQNHEDVFYAVPKGNITTIDVINLYAKYYKDLYCQVSEQNIVEKDGYVFVPCSGKDYVVFKFSASATGSLGVVTDLLCPEGSIGTMHYDGKPTYCKNVSHKDCETVKDIVNGKIYVEWIDDYSRSDVPWGNVASWSGVCQIGEKGK